MVRTRRRSRKRIEGEKERKIERAINYSRDGRIVSVANRAARLVPPASASLFPSADLHCNSNRGVSVWFSRSPNTPSRSTFRCDTRGTISRTSYFAFIDPKRHRRKSISDADFFSGGALWLPRARARARPAAISVRLFRANLRENLAKARSLREASLT